MRPQTTSMNVWGCKSVSLMHNASNTMRLHKMNPVPLKGPFFPGEFPEGYPPGKPSPHNKTGDCPSPFPFWFLCKTSVKPSTGVKQALMDLCLGIRVGERFGFLGANGAGKTTALSIVAARRRPTSGAAFVAGHPAGSPPGAEPWYKSLYSSVKVYTVYHITHLKSTCMRPQPIVQLGISAWVEPGSRC